eukprot:TRINITY_DN1839_c2_g1_i1.p1 TRINITY_DN1839_c2_g1~~TRINITY_DN1839_c2_g1_i1.p1  ORF type:complete len:632 (+),score=56.64 TRINITY_DN1839_c2_g1_i1:116-1897(+)
MASIPMASELLTEDHEHDLLFKLVLVGPSKAGKTALLNRYHNDCFSEASVLPGFGREREEFKIKLIELSGRKIKLQIWDPAGQEPSRLRGAHGVLLCYDVTNEDDYYTLPDILQDIDRRSDFTGTIALTACKCDCQALRKISEAQGRALADTHSAMYVETSAKEDGSSVDRAFEALCMRVLDAQQRPIVASEAPSIPLHKVEASASTWTCVNWTWADVKSGLAYALFAAELLILTCGMTAADIGSDVLAVRTYFHADLKAFFAIGCFLLVCPMTCCWAYLATAGKAEWYEAPLYILQIKTLQEVVASLREGKKAFGLLFINVCEVCFESFPQSLLSTYSLLIGMPLGSGKSILGLSPTQVFEGSVLVSWMSAAKFLATIDEYDTATSLCHKNPFIVSCARMLFRFSEVSLRVLSLAAFAAIMRPSTAGVHDNVQVAIWRVLLVDFIMMYVLTKCHAKPGNSVWLYAAICVLCAPMHFMRAFRKSLPLYYLFRVFEMIVLVAIVVKSKSLEKVLAILHRDEFLLTVGEVSLMIFISCLLINTVLSYVLPRARLSRVDDIIGAYEGEGSWLIIPLEKKQGPPGNYKMMALPLTPK